MDKKRWRSVSGVFVSLIILGAVGQRASAAPPEPVRFEKLTLDDKYNSCGVAIGDIDKDGHLDVIAGAYWYAGPDFKTRHTYYPPEKLDPASDSSENKLTYVYDFNGDGWLDVLVVPRPDRSECFWYENPGKAALASAGEVMWKKHSVFKMINGEAPQFADIDGDGKPELITHWLGRWGWIKPDWADPTKPWEFVGIGGKRDIMKFYHGTGVGDVNGDGRLDIVVNDGWFEQPVNPKGEWIEHKFKFGERGGADIYVYDVNGDGKNDVISSLDGHGWGLAWFEQVIDNGQITFKKHMIMGNRSEEAKYGLAFSQLHALALADIDGDGLKDIVTGKRWWAHGPKKDEEPMGTPVIYYFRLVREKNGEAHYEPHLIDNDSGTGVQVLAVDMNGDGRPDVVTSGRKGTFVFINRKNN